jgi:dihydroneopterin aldolase
VKKKLSGWVGLKKLEIHANHGVYDDEKKNGNTFALDIQVKGDLRKAVRTDNIADAINYETIAAVCKEEMEIPSDTLEHIGYRIVKSLFSRLPVSRVKLRIAKSSPPIGQPCLASTVTFNMKRGEL